MVWIDLFLSIFFPIVLGYQVSVSAGRIRRLQSQVMMLSQQLSYHAQTQSEQLVREQSRIVRTQEELAQQYRKK